MEASVSIWLAFSAGLLSFLSPCCLPLYPSYLSYITGVSVSRLKEEGSQKELRKRTILHTLFFILGFSIIYIALGLGASFLGRVFFQYGDLIRQLSGILIVVMGLFLLGWLKSEWLMKDIRFEWKKKPTGYLGSTMVGFGFAAGWTPCVGPILTAILAMAAVNPDEGLKLILAYTAGFAVPFFLLAFFIGSTKWILKYSPVLMKVGGGVMIVMGILLFTDQLTKITVYLNNFFGTSWF
ncbi:cytochrome c biogenesis protein CcdA [Microaerobacter geothermalis]|uniref:cytochrome c biogenesis CcdA family protein n=1 Tax=Microaerobacter geothermalis TaxID=674972 RepID=UPI001F375CD6|nr:cytochrome c biogenesis protein CcdA [Microaerobacter geothermalis]MCF6092530.1 cytochrome c biogenesis protein CcdA [Microaerobacter geothermalis]